MVGFFFVVVLVVVIVMLARAADKKAQLRRADAMKELASRLGLEYVPMIQPQGCLTFGMADAFFDPITGSMGKTDAIMQFFNGFDPFGQGGSRKIENLIVGPKGDEQWMLFDYQYTISSGKSSSTYYYGIVSVVMPLAMPPLQIRPANFGDTVGAWFGAKDIQFESDQFNKEFTIHCAEEKRAYDIIDPQMMEYLMSIPRYAFQFSGNVGLIALGGKTEPAVYYQTAGDLEGFLQRIPNFVRQDIGYKPTWPTQSH